MSHRQQIWNMAIRLTVVTVGFILITILILFYIDLAREKVHLTYLVTSQARLIESVAQFDQVYSLDYPEGALAATLSQVADANIYFEGFGDTGEFTMAQLAGDQISFLYSPRLAEGDGPLSIPLDSDLAEPMRRALRGESGTVIGRDYQGNWVVAAYEPVAYLHWGLVAKQDIFRVMSPYIIVLIVIGISTIVLIRLGERLFLAATDPVLDELAETNLRYVHALKKTETAVFGQDANLRYIYLYHPYLEREELQVIGKTDDEIFREDEAGTLMDVKQKVVAQKATIREIVPMSFGSDTHMMDLIVEPSLDQDGNVLGVFGSATNVTDLVESKLNAEFQAQLLQSAGEAIVYSNLDNQVEYWNAGAEKQYGLSAEEALGQNITILLAPSEHEATAHRMRSVLEEGSWRGRIQHINQAGNTFWVDAQVFLVRDKDKNPIGFIGVNRDIGNMVLAEESLKRSITRLGALHKIDKSITGSTDLNLMLDVLIEQVHTNLKVDAVAILIGNDFGHLELAAMVGFDPADTEFLKKRAIKEGPALDALHDRQTIEFHNPEPGSVNSQFPQLLLKEKFSSYFAYPLIARGEPLGVLEIFNRTPLHPDEDWRGFLATLAEQSSIALHSSRAVENLRQTKRDLEIAYAATLEGWARALELRDAETAGHSERVTEMTLRLAVSLGVPANELIHISRGSLLHDIGKMGIPDQILNKAGPLDDEEWEIMHTHPLLAHQLLSKISYLRPALEIPLWHHERWDGSGYPHGLQGEEIPLPARIFAVVDVWDALCSDRPYRLAWDQAKVVEHIQQEAGKHFDPTIVTAFLELEPEYK